MEESVEKEKVDIKTQIAATLIEAMKTGNTPWQKPWCADAMRPMNPTSGNSYRGINRLLLSLAGRSDPRYMTYQQAAQNGWQVRKGEKGLPIVKLVEMGRERQEESGANPAPSGTRSVSQDRADDKRFVLRRYAVFNAEQIDGIPPLPEQGTMSSTTQIERAEGVLNGLKATGLTIIHGGPMAVYIPAMDEIRLPQQGSFHSMYDYYATALHEGAHATLHESRMNRAEALGKRWGDEAYAMEELRAEICSAMLSAETGVPMSQDHIQNHAAYLNSWIEILGRDPMAIFSAAKDAELMAAYLLGLEAKIVASAVNNEWSQDYDREMERQACLSR